MKTTLRIFALILVISAFMGGAPLVWAQPYPNRPVQLIIPIPAGGGGDVNGRLLVEDLIKILGQQIVVVNKPGASDTLGTDALAKSKKDGYTLGYTSSAAMVFARVTNPESVPYDPVKDFDPLGSHTFFPLCVAVQANSPWKTFNDLIDYAKKNPGKLRVSTAGVGSTANFDVEITKTLTGAEFTHVPFKGGEAVVTALLGGHVEVSYDIVGKFMPHVEVGKVRILLVSRKISFLPKIPTITELGYKRELLSGWHGMFGPAGLPEDVKTVLIPAIEKAVKQPETKAKIENTGYAVEYKSPEEQRRLIMGDYETAKAIAAKLGLGK
ncbi:MAG TPA: tripartite tricarboxylate transporter substrate binding protein [Thermodesulfobacteriota bacterium]|nr:tripartite tricarboxylate transporter substrate binding protein [Thermodesulfobacteriota bacterium]